MQSGVMLVNETGYRTLLEKLESLENKLKLLTEKQQPLSETWLDNQEASQLLKVSYRTLQNYRDRGVLPYTMLGGKIYYSAEAIEKILKENLTNKA